MPIPEDFIKPISPADFNKLASNKVPDCVRAINQYMLKSLRQGDVSKIDITTAVEQYNELTIDLALADFLDAGWICERGENNELFLLSEVQTENPIQNAIDEAHGEDSVEDSTAEDSNQDSVLADSNAEPGDSEFLGTTPGP